MPTPLSRGPPLARTTTGARAAREETPRATTCRRATPRRASGSACRYDPGVTLAEAALPGAARRPHDHAVQVYTEPHELARGVADHLASAFESERPALVVASPAHWELFAEELRDRGFHDDRLRADKELLVLDAAETLSSAMLAGRPSRSRFDETVLGALDRVDPLRERTVHVYGEMVDILCRRGDTSGTTELEELWNRLAARRSLALLCGYCVDIFDRAAQVSVLPMVCAAHTHVVPAGDPERLERAVDAALAETLGPQDADKVYALVADGIRLAAVPPAQLALMWVSAHMPRLAQRVLAS